MNAAIIITIPDAKAREEDLPEIRETASYLVAVLSEYHGLDATARVTVTAEDGIETGTTRRLPAIGRDACAAVRRARDHGTRTTITIDGDPVAAITPLP